MKVLLEILQGESNEGDLERRSLDGEFVWAVENHFVLAKDLPWLQSKHMEIFELARLPEI